MFVPIATKLLKLIGKGFLFPQGNKRLLRRLSSYVTTPSCTVKSISRTGNKRWESNSCVRPLKELTAESVPVN